MKYKRFDVVELNNGNKATILNIKNKEYYAEIVDSKGNRVDIKNIQKMKFLKLYLQNKTYGTG